MRMRDILNSESDKPLYCHGMSHLKCHAYIICGLGTISLFDRCLRVATSTSETHAQISESAKTRDAAETHKKVDVSAAKTSLGGLAPLAGNTPHKIQGLRIS